VASPPRPAPGAPARPISFGTSGWRGVRGVDFDGARVALAARAVAAWLDETAPGGEVVVARDTRPGGPEFVDIAVRSLSAFGLRPIVAHGAVPTPAAVHALRSRGAAAAIVFTASHNPPEYAGMKVFDARGGILDAAASERIEVLAAGLAAGSGAAEREAAPDAPSVDVIAPYLAELLTAIDRDALRGSDLRIVYDAMHATGAGVLDRALRSVGATVRTLRAEPAPDFGGGAPDPDATRLGELRASLRELSGRRVGVATDGDADRFAVVAEDGSCLNATDALALLVDHLAETRRVHRGVAISLATGSLVARVAEARGLWVERHPIGFKHLSWALQAGRVDVAGEESGGFALAGFGCDKDGVLAGLLIAEMFSDGSPPAERLADLRRRHGAGVCGRSARSCDAEASAAFTALAAAPPERFDGARVTAVRGDDGLHLALDDGFVMLRRSGTEPLLRIYAEAPDHERLAQRLAAGRALLPD
jgi:phosphoglucomutase